MVDFLSGLSGPHAVYFVEGEHQSENVNATVLLPPRAANHVMEVHWKPKTATLKYAQVSCSFAYYKISNLQAVSSRATRVVWLRSIDK